VTAVQKLMQTQHKSMLRELKAGAFDEKISKFLGHPIEKKAGAPEANPDATPSGIEAIPPPPIATAPTEAAMSAIPLVEPSISPSALAEPRPLEGPDEPFEEPPTDRTAIPPLDTDKSLDQAATAAQKSGDTDRKVTVPPPSSPRLTPLRPPAATGNRPSLPPLRPPVRPPTGTRPPSSVGVPRQPAGIGGRRPTTGTTASYAGKPTAEGVVVARPAVIVGGNNPSPPTRPPGQTKPPTSGRSSGRWHPVQANQPPAPPPPADKRGDDNIFGGDLISEKSLDEVILAYLSEDLNDK
jgi:hypothetical protein